MTFESADQDYETLSDAVRSVAAQIDVPFDALMAVAITETRGQVIPGLPIIATEGHVFWRNLPEHMRKPAREKGLAWPRWEPGRHPRSQVEARRRLQQMLEIDVEAAYAATSMGWGQVLGENANSLGFASCASMWSAAQTLRGQTELVGRFIEANDLAESLRAFPSAGAVAQFAKRYNGPLFRRNRYHTKLIDNYRDVVSGAWEDPAEKRAEILALQRDLKRVGFDPGPIDGVMGGKTRDAVRAFQREEGLAIDGVPGRMTRGALEARIEGDRRERAPIETASGGLIAGAGSIGAVILGARESVNQVVDTAESWAMRAGLDGEILGGIVAVATAAAVWRFVVRPILDRRRVRP